MKTPAEIVVALEAMGWTQDRIAIEVGTNQPNVSRWKTGSEPRGKTWDRLHGLARTLGIIEPPKPALPAAIHPPKGTKIQLVPLISWISAGKLSGSEVPPNVRPEKRIPVADLRPGHWIALRVQGTSMNLVAPDGAVIFANMADKRLIEDGFYVFKDDSGDATFKRYRGGRKPRMQPFSTSPDHETIPLEGPIEVVGRVHRVVYDLT